MHDIAGNYDQVTVRKALLTGPACRQLDRVVFGRAPPCGGFQRDRRRKLLGVGERGCVGGGTLLMRAALPALDAAAALIDPDGYLWMFGGNNGPGTVLHTRRHAAWANALALPHSSCVQLCLL